ncbi:glutathione S-transferase [Candidatus Igneacidithiobacillus taiwanensis]|uniref:glutathione S-transferase n=1 Tax=Candidatus Igneacidithiobacillus taiwanensis TaxID=1945924 RepID=UPI00289CF2C0|nr:glutathione S-transferase [Candidatus Igneacidithiobacillus taiwanensis]MCE5360097.1 glutathione S-transferase [Acidithiobacillus sp.]
MSEPTLYFHWSDPQALRLRLLLGAKEVSYRQQPCRLQDLETPFDLGQARLPVLCIGEQRWTGNLEDLPALDATLPSPVLAVAAAEWQAFCAWRQDLDALLQRLIAPVQPAFAEIADDPEDLRYFRQEKERQFGQSLEALANDRYGAYQQLARRGRLLELGKLLAKNRFYVGTLSLVDIALCADLQLLRLLDGVTLPIDLQYYFQRVAEHCRVSLQDGMRPN